MLVRFGYVAMTVQLENASPSRTMTMANFAKLPDREAGLRRLERIAEENLANTLRILKHNRYMGVDVYRFTSKFIPLKTHEDMADWDPYPALEPSFAAVGDFVKKHGMRTSLHPDHFTVLSTPRPEVLAKSVNDLEHHVRMLELMGLDERSTCNIHVGGSYGDKSSAGERFVHHFQALDRRISGRLTLENDDKTFNLSETLEIAETVGAPMVIDLHHHAVNPDGSKAEELWPRIAATWKGRIVPPKIHYSSPKSASDPRGHADHVEASPLARFLLAIAADTPAVDVMLEAKRKDEALFRLMDDFKRLEAAGAPFAVTGGASIKVG